MFLKYTAACAIVIAIVVFLRFVEDSPINSWKRVVLTSLLLAGAVCYWISWSFPPGPPPLPRQTKADRNRAELLRTFRRIGGVDRAEINGSVILLNFIQPKSLNEFKSIAMSTGATAAHFMQVGNSNHITVQITVNGRNRYEMEYDTARGVVNEREF